MGRLLEPQEVQNIIAHRPPGTTAQQVMVGLIHRGYVIRGLNDQATGAAGFMSGLGKDLVNPQGQLGQALPMAVGTVAELGTMPAMGPASIGIGAGAAGATRLGQHWASQKMGLEPPDGEGVGLDVLKQAGWQGLAGGSAQLANGVAKMGARGFTGRWADPGGAMRQEFPGLVDNILNERGVPAESGSRVLGETGRKQAVNARGKAAGGRNKLLDDMRKAGISYTWDDFTKNLPELVQKTAEPAGAEGDILRLQEMMDYDARRFHGQEFTPMETRSMQRANFRVSRPLQKAKGVPGAVPDPVSTTRGEYTNEIAHGQRNALGPAVQERDRVLQEKIGIARAIEKAMSGPAPEEAVSRAAELAGGSMAYGHPTLGTPTAILNAATPGMAKARLANLLWSPATRAILHIAPRGYQGVNNGVDDLLSDPYIMSRILNDPLAK